MRVVLGSDHGGFTLKEAIKAHLLEQGHTCEDVGCFDQSSCDYPLIAEQAGQALLAGKGELGILCCGTGIGISMAANKVKGIRAACCSDYFSAKYTRLHNNANFLCLGGRVLGIGLALELVDVFLNTPFEGGRHARRVNQIGEIEARQ